MVIVDKEVEVSTSGTELVDIGISGVVVVSRVDGVDRAPLLNTVLVDVDISGVVVVVSGVDDVDCFSLSGTVLVDI